MINHGDEVYSKHVNQESTVNGRYVTKVKVNTITLTGLFKDIPIIAVPLCENNKMDILWFNL